VFNVKKIGAERDKGNRAVILGGGKDKISPAETTFRRGYFLQQKDRLLQADCLIRTYISACAALCASIWVDRIDITS
jgi:hypothetical protein